MVVAYDEVFAHRIRELLQDEPDVIERAMFGGLAFLIHGNMAVSASARGGLMVRVDPTDSPELAARPHAERMVMRGREMDGWLRIDPEGLRTKRDLQRWVQLGVAYAHTLAPKAS